MATLEMRNRAQR